MRQTKRNMNAWQELINAIRQWDRIEHNWSISDKWMDHKNLVTKNTFIHSLMKKYKLQKRKK